MSAEYKVVSDAGMAFRFLNAFFPIDHSVNEKGICLLRNGIVQAASLYYDFNGSNIWFHHACRPGRKSLTRDMIKWTFHYPFIQLGVRRLSCGINANNLASIRLVEHSGFKREATLRGAGVNGVDALIYVMFREDCRYVEPLHATDALRQQASDQRLRPPDRGGGAGQHAGGSAS